MNPTENCANCMHCKKSLKKFTKTNDWEKRNFHIKCHNKIMKSIELNHFIDLMNKKYGSNVPLVDAFNFT